MDIAIHKPKHRISPVKIAVGFGLLVLVGFAIHYLLVLGEAEFSIKRSTLTVSEVRRGAYTVSVRGTGVLVPDNIQWLTADVEGTVVKRVLRAGNEVKQGELIIELSNPQLLQQLSEAKWELEALQAQLKAEKVDQLSSIQQQKSNTLNAKMDYESSQSEFEARAELIKTGAVSKLEYDRAIIRMQQAERRWESSRATLEKMEENLLAQEDARQARLNQTRNRVERIEQQADSLQVRATINGTILEVPVEPGQRVSMGDSLAKLAQEDSLIAQLRVPELQIREVAIGQRVVVDTRNSKINGTVSRIDPAVLNGNVLVDVTLEGTLPDDVRPDLSVDGEIMIAELQDAIFVNRPLFAQSRSQSAVYKLSANGEFVERVKVNLGFGSINQIQILDGLQVGDKIVISDPTRLQSYEKIRIN